MIRRSVFASIGGLIAMFCLSWHINAQEPNEWKVKELSRAGISKLEHIYDQAAKLRVRLDGDLSGSVGDSCGDADCLDLFYFKGNHFNLRDRTRRNILYIPGGPGRIPGKNELSFLEQNHNVVYFFLRGIGRSQINKSNTFDRFLKAEFVVSDIERLRAEVLDGRNWDAIYALSYGTVIAQQYAWAHPENVGRLILESPVARQRDFRQPARKVGLDNLRKIYTLISFDSSTPCDCSFKPDKLRARNIKFTDNLVAGDNFCLLRGSSAEERDSTIERITAQLENVYEKLETEYGNLSIVTENYEDLKDDGKFREDFPYPKEFFAALRQIQSSGAPQDENALLFGDLVQQNFVIPQLSSVTTRRLVQLN